MLGAASAAEIAARSRTPTPPVTPRRNTSGTAYQATYEKRDPLFQVEKELAELEAKLQEVESAAEVIQFDSIFQPSVTAGGKRAALQAQEGAAAKLAEEVSSELSRWRQRREEAYSTRRRANEKRQQEVLQGQKEEEEDRKHVRVALRNALFEEASHALAGKLPDELRGVVPRQPPQTSFGQGADDYSLPFEDVGAGVEALTQLVKELDVRADRMAKLEPSPPNMMRRAIAIGELAMERKIERCKRYKQQFEGLADQAVQPLMMELEDGFQKRLDSQLAQLHQETAILNGLKDSADSRKEAFEDLEAMNRAGPGAIPKDWWSHLLPTSKAEENSEDEDNRHSTQDPDEELEELRQRIIRWGKERHAELCATFQRRHFGSAAEQSHQGHMAEAGLEEWRLTACLDLVEKLKEAAASSHESVTSRLKALLQKHNNRGANSMAAERIAEDFLEAKAEVFTGEGTAAAAGFAEQAWLRLTPLQSGLRKAELVALKRRAAIEQDAKAMAQQAERDALLQLVEAVHRLLTDCHSALPLPAPVLKVSEAVKTCPLLLSWERASTPMAERIQSIARFLEDQPATAEICAIEQSLLCIIEEEIKSLCNRLA